jgi:hypothetical protein
MPSAGAAMADRNESQVGEGTRALAVDKAVDISVDTLGLTCGCDGYPKSDSDREAQWRSRHGQPQASSVSRETRA